MDIIYSVDISEYDMIGLNTNHISCLNHKIFLSEWTYRALREVSGAQYVVFGTSLCTRMANR